MTKTSEIQKDLNFISEVVNASEKDRGVPAIYFLWALIVPIGYGLIDFYPQLSGQFWMIAGPVGGVLSGLLGWRYSKKTGQVENKEFQKNAIHWGAMLAAIFMAVNLVNLGLITKEGLSAVCLLIVSLSYILAGNYMDRTFLWLGAVLMLGYFPLVNNIGYTWTILGAVISLGLVISGVKSVRNGKS